MPTLKPTLNCWQLPGGQCWLLKTEEVTFINTAPEGVVGAILCELI